MKISSLLQEGITAASSPENAQSPAPKFGRSDKFLEEKTDEKVEECTTSGSVATVTSPVGQMQRRGKGSIFAGIKTSDKYPNSKAVKESVNPQNFDSDVDYYNAVKKQGQQQFSGDWDVYDEIASLENQIKYTKSSALAHTLYQKIDQLKQQAGIEDDEDEYEKEYDADIRARKGLEEAGFTDTIKRGVKNIKRGLQGWDKNLEGPGGEKLGDPKDIVRRNKSYSDDTTLQLAKRKELGFPFGGDSTTGEHTPRGLQRKVLDREIKRRGLTPEEGVAEDQLDEKSKSQAQFRTMAAVAHNPKFAKKVGISQKVGKEFHKADKKSDYEDLPARADEEKQRLDPKCWTGYKKQGTKMKGGVRVNNCVKVDEAEFTEDKLAQDLYRDLQIFKKGADKDIGTKAKDKEIGQKPKDKDIIAKEAANAAQQAAIAIAMKKKGQKPQNEDAEYDDEAGSTESNLLTTARAVKGLIDTIDDRDNLPEWVQEKIAKAEGMLVATWDYLQSQKEQGIDPQVDEDWQKTNRKDKTDGMSPKAVKAYRRENPGSKLQTAVTKKPSELKAGSKDAKRRKSFCARMSGNPGPMKDEHGKPTPKAKALKRWNC